MSARCRVVRTHAIYITLNSTFSFAQHTHTITRGARESQALHVVERVETDSLTEQGMQLVPVATLIANIRILLLLQPLLPFFALPMGLTEREVTQLTGRSLLFVASGFPAHVAIFILVQAHLQVLFVQSLLPGMLHRVLKGTLLSRQQRLQMPLIKHTQVLRALVDGRRSLLRLASQRGTLGVRRSLYQLRLETSEGGLLGAAVVLTTVPHRIFARLLSRVGKLVAVHHETFINVGGYVGRLAAFILESRAHVTRERALHVAQVKQAGAF